MSRIHQIAQLHAHLVLFVMDINVFQLWIAHVSIMASHTRVVNYGPHLTVAAIASVPAEKFSVNLLLVMSLAVQSVLLCMLLKVAVAQNVYLTSATALIQKLDINTTLVNHGLIVMMPVLTALVIPTEQLAALARSAIHQFQNVMLMNNLSQLSADAVHITNVSVTKKSVILPNQHALHTCKWLLLPRLDLVAQPLIAYVTRPSVLFHHVPSTNDLSDSAKPTNAVTNTSAKIWVAHTTVLHTMPVI
jgi:hypothetical protein